MTPAQAAHLLTCYNRWRRGKPSPMTLVTMDTKKIGEAIDLAIAALEKKKKAKP